MTIQTLKKLWFLLILICIAGRIVQTEAKYMFKMGNLSPSSQLVTKYLGNLTLETPKVVFEYFTTENVAYIEIISEDDLQGDVSFSFLDDLLRVEFVTNVEELNTRLENSSSLIIEINIYANRNGPIFSNMFGRQYKGVGVMKNVTDISFEDLEDYSYINDEDTSSELIAVSNENDIEETMTEEEPYMEFVDEDPHTANIGYSEEEEATEEEFISNNEDEIIEIGKRQPNDQLLYETFQTSKLATPNPGNHTTVFYYIDSVFITSVKFVIYGSFIGKNTASNEYKSPTVEYSHASENSLKAVITDFNADSLTVQMMVYGYYPSELSQNYVPFLDNSMQNDTNDPTEGHSITNNNNPLDYTRLPSGDTKKLAAMERESITSSATSVIQNNAIAKLFLLTLGLLQLIRTK